jgi:3-phosphoglycerate kinase
MKPKPCVAGLLLAEEVRFLRDVLEAPGRPFVAVMGGAKVSDKLGAIKNLVGRIDTLLVGGAMAYTLLKVLGHKVGSSLVEEERLDDAREIVRMIESSSTEMRLPIDHVCGRALSSVSPLQIVDGDIPEHWMGLDIGPQTTAEFTNVLRGAKTIVWNGPMGAFETMPFDVGTRQLALALAAATHNGATTIVGGGDTVAAVKLAGVVDRVGHVSTGGGASIRMLEGRALPGLEPLDEATAAV